MNSHLQKILLSFLFLSNLLFGQTGSAIEPQPEIIDLPNGDIVLIDFLGMPKMIIPVAEPSRAYVLTTPNGSIYQRKIFLTPIVVANDFSKKNSQRERQWYQLQFQLNTILSYYRSKVTLPLGAASIFGIPLDFRTRQAMEQMSRGGHEYRAENSVEAYLQVHPLHLKDYTVAMNRSLTEKFGAGFSSEIYHYLLAKESSTLSDLQEVYELTQKHLHNERPLEAAKVGAIKIFVVKGYLQSLEGEKDPDPESIDAIIDSLKKRGQRIQIAQTHTGDSVEANAAISAEELEVELRRGEKIVLLGCSKGAPEALGALAILNRKGILTDPKVKGKLVGAIMGSGVVGGSLIADWAIQWSRYPLARVLLGQIAKNANVSVTDYYRGLQSLTSESLQKYMATTIADLPKGLKYINLIGIVEHQNGFLQYSSYRTIQERLMTSSFFDKHGANDGLAEYPSLGLPLGSVPHLKNIISVHSDHSFFKGQLADLNFHNAATREAFMVSLVDILLQSEKALASF